MNSKLLIFYIAVWSLVSPTSLLASAADSDPVGCENFWEYACKTYKGIGSEQNSANAARIYSKYFLEEADRKKLLAPLRKLLKKNGDPLTKLDVNDMTENFENFYKKSGKKPLYEYAKKYLLAKPLFDPQHHTTASLIAKYFEMANERRPNTYLLKNYIVTSDEPKNRALYLDKLGKFFGDMDVGLDDVDFVSMVKDFATLGLRTQLHPVESAVNAQRAFRERVEKALFTSDQKASVIRSFEEIKKTAAGVIGPVDKKDHEALDSVTLAFPSDIENEFTQAASFSSASWSPWTSQIQVKGTLPSADEYQVLAILAHEYGHAIEMRLKDPKWKAIHQALTDCLKFADAAKITEEQSHEAIADWYSSEILGRMLHARSRDRSLDQKRRAVASCITSCDSVSKYKDRYHNGRIFVTAPYPRWDVRTNRIFLANPSLREAIGCTPSKNPKHCELVK